jgi:hypothetical protein
MRSLTMRRMHGPSSPPPSLLLQVVERSPAHVAAQDRDAWLALFARDGAVEDPVGAAPNPRDALARFYETFIAGNQIHFEVIEDLTAGHEVVRDVIIHTRLSTGLEIDVPAYLLYELVDEDGALRILRLRAVWDLRRRSTGALAAGLRGLWTLCAVSLRMLRVQGLAGVLGYSRGLVSGIFGRGPKTLARLSAALAAGDPPTAQSLFTADARVEFPVGAPTSSVPDWLTALGPGAALQLSHATAAGWLTACRFTVESGPHAGTGGVAFFEFDPATRKIASARLFARAHSR